MGDSWTSATPLRNADFKALLSTPRPAALQSQQAAGAFKAPRPKTHGSGEGGERKFKKPHKKPGGKGGKPGAKEGDDDEGPQYRDRAKERRDGLNADFADAETELAARGLAPGALAHLSIEQSKFLGGDIAHTHLVKGLDYALLHQERQKLESAGGAKGGAPAVAAASSAAAAPSAKAAAAAAAASAAATAPVQFATPQGRALYNALFRPPPIARGLVREMFQPRRTAFVYDTGDDARDVPTTLRRSKADCPPVQDLVSAASDGSVLERISQIMSYLASVAAPKAGKRSARDSAYIRGILAGANPGDAQMHGQLVMKGAAAAPGPGAAGGGGGGSGPGDGLTAAAAVAEEDDIFGDAGTDYVAPLPTKKDGQARRAEGLFEGDEHREDLRAPPPSAAAAAGGAADMDAEEGELPGSRYPRPPPQQQDWQQQQQQQGYHQAGWQQPQQPQQDEPKWRVRTKPGAAAAAAEGFADEAYAECFPSMADFEDEEEDPKRKGAAGEEGAEGEAAGAKGAKGKGKGGKAGRGGGLDDAEKKLNQKLSREVHQMQGIFKEKGWGSEAAFKKPDKLDAVAATPARKRLRL